MPLDKLDKMNFPTILRFTYWYKDSPSREDILGEFKDGGQIQVEKLVMLMLTTRDNTASLWLQKISRYGTRLMKYW